MRFGNWIAGGFRIVTGMEAPPTDLPDGRADLVSRRRLLQLAGAASLAATVSACSTTGVESAAGHTPRPGPSSTTTARPEATPIPNPPSQIVASPTPASSAPSGVLLCRDAWGARPARSGGRRQTITRMTLHHAGVVLGDNRNVVARLREDQRYHQDDLGWIDIAYHVGVDRSGNIFELRAPEFVGDTATSYDPTGHFLVICEGDFDKETVTENQLQGAALAFASAAQSFHISTDTLAGHRDFAATSCPGANLYAHLASGDLKRRIDDLLAAGPVDLQRVCGPEADAIVVAIEAGQ